MTEGYEVAIVQDAQIVAREGDIAGLHARYETLKQAAGEVLRKGVDFGVIPGTDKPTLHKPGAEKLCTLFHLHPSFNLEGSREDWEGGFFFYRYKCTLRASDGTFVGEGIGSCNTKEPRYRYRTTKRKCPQCNAEAVFRSKYPPRDNPDAPPGWYCFDKKGGCGANFPFVAPEITSQQLGRAENPEPYELVNTVDKMAQKRALVAAVLVATGASEFFTQDMEDMGGGEPPQKPPVTRQPKKRQARRSKKKDTRMWGELLMKAKSEIKGADGPYYTSDQHVVNTLRKERGDKNENFWESSGELVGDFDELLGILVKHAQGGGA